MQNYISAYDFQLTPEQQKLAEEHHKLIYSFAKKRNLDLEEFYGLLAIGLCEAARTFDKSLGYKFSTLAYTFMKNEYLQYIRTQYNLSHIPSEQIVSYTQLLGGKFEGTDITEVIATDFILNKPDLTKAEIDEFFNLLTRKQKIVLNGILFGYKEVELSLYLGVSKQRINQIKKEIQKKWEKYIKVNSY